MTMITADTLATHQQELAQLVAQKRRVIQYDERGVVLLQLFGEIVRCELQQNESDACLTVVVNPQTCFRISGDMTLGMLTIEWSEDRSRVVLASFAQGMLIIERS